MEPKAICAKRLKSPALFRPAPSARFAGTETAARRDWLVSPYNSSRGQDLVIAYTSFTISIATRQTSRSWTLFGPTRSSVPECQKLSSHPLTSIHPPLTIATRQALSDPTARIVSGRHKLSNHPLTPIHSPLTIATRQAPSDPIARIVSGRHKLSNHPLTPIHSPLTTHH